MLADNNSHHATNSQLVYPEIIRPKTKPEKIQPAKKRKTVTEAEEQELRDLLKFTGYSTAEIREKIEKKRIKYGRVKNVKKIVAEQVNEAEIRRKRMAEKQKEHLEINIKEMIYNMTAPIDNAEMFDTDKKNMIKQINKYVTEELNKRWEYNERMAKLLTCWGYNRENVISLINQLSIHHDIETIYQRCYFKELEWKIKVPESNLKAREISLHNYSILKVQILMNQHNQLYNAKAKVAHPTPIRQKHDKEIRKELIFSLQNLELHKKALENDCTETKQYFNSLINLNLIHENIHSKIIWNNSLYPKEVKSSHIEKNIRKSNNQLVIIKKLEDFRKTNKLRYKLNEEEKNMLNKMLLNCYTEKHHMNQ
jgi:hypothetical protein